MQSLCCYGVGLSALLRTVVDAFYFLYWALVAGVWWVFCRPFSLQVPTGTESSYLLRSVRTAAVVISLWCAWHVIPYLFLTLFSRTVCACPSPVVFVAADALMDITAYGFVSAGESLQKSDIPTGLEGVTSDHCFCRVKPFPSRPAAPGTCPIWRFPAMPRSGKGSNCESCGKSWSVMLPCSQYLHSQSLMLAPRGRVAYLSGPRCHPAATIELC